MSSASSSNAPYGAAAPPAAQPAAPSPPKFKRLPHPPLMTELKLEINGLTGPQLNRIRRTLYQCPNISFVDCTIFANDTGVSDQVMSHQLVMVPIYVDPAFALAWHDRNRTIAETDDNTLVFTVTIDCPPPSRVESTTETGAPVVELIDHEVHVFARDLRFNPVGKQADEWISHPHYSPSIVPVMVLHPDMRLMTLKSRGRRSFHAELKAALGSVEENTRFTDVLNCYFRPIPTIRIEKTIANKDARVLLHLCKQAVFGWDRDNSDRSSNNSSHDWKEHTRLEAETYYDALENERTYNVQDTLIPTLRDGFGAEPIVADTPRLRVAHATNCTLCMACKNASLVDMEDLAKPSLHDALTIAIPATRFLFFLRCNAKRPAVDLLQNALAAFRNDTDPVLRGLYPLAL